MIRLLGILCILSAGGSVWYLQRQERQKKRQILAELAAALNRMETGIRLEQIPLRSLFQQAAQGCCREVSALFTCGVQALASGRPPEDAWRQAISSLPVSEADKRALSELIETLQSDESSACKGILLAESELRDSLAQLERQRPEEEKRATALCFSSAALLVILLI